VTLIAINGGSRVPVEDPFFLLYDSRSGSTFLANELAKRFEVAIPPETNFVTYLLTQFGHACFETRKQMGSLAKTISSDPKFSDLKIGRGELEALLCEHPRLDPSDVVRLVLDRFREHKSLQGHRYGLKKGSYIFHYRDLLRMFPKAKFIALIRDGRAVFNSKKTSIYSATGEPMEVNVRKAAREWTRITNLMRELEVDHPEVLIVRYETLIHDVDGTIDAVGSFLEAEPARSNRGDNAYEIADRYDYGLHRNVGKAPEAERISAWREGLSAAEIATYESVAGDCLAREGYELVNGSKSSSLLARLLT
jgi:hypothetical protein